jgi:hypothetical protein
MKMKLPPDVSFHHDLRLMVWRPRGILGEKAVNKIVALLEQEEDRATKSFDRFTDVSKLDAIDLGLHFVSRVSLHRRSVYAQRPPVKSAFYVTSEAVERIVKIHVLTTSHSPLQCAMFKTLAETAEWLGVPVETLEM